MKHNASHLERSGLIDGLACQLAAVPRSDLVVGTVDLNRCPFVSASTTIDDVERMHVTKQTFGSKTSLKPGRTATASA
jgi:hypothetical protein